MQLFVRSPHSTFPITCHPQLTVSSLRHILTLPQQTLLLHRTLLPSHHSLQQCGLQSYNTITLVSPLAGGSQEGWHGYYQQYGSKHQMEFKDFKRVGNNVQGSGEDEVGQFSIKGDVDGSDVSFVKQYIGKHAVLYEGTVQGNTLKGKWSIGAANGHFVIGNKQKIQMKELAITIHDMVAK